MSSRIIKTVVQPRPVKVYARNIEGLRDALFDEIEDLRSGASASHEAIAFSSLAERVIDTVEIEIKQRALTLEARRQRLEAIRLQREHQQELLPAPELQEPEYVQSENLPM